MLHLATLKDSILTHKTSTFALIGTNYFDPFVQSASQVSRLNYYITIMPVYSLKDGNCFAPDLSFPLSAPNVASYYPGHNITC